MIGCREGLNPLFTPCKEREKRVREGRMKNNDFFVAFLPSLQKKREREEKEQKKGALKNEKEGWNMVGWSDGRIERRMEKYLFYYLSTLLAKRDRERERERERARRKRGL